jgi:hypothetical protein
MAAVGPDRMSAGADLILRAAERTDPRPLWVLAWGGTNTLAQALLHAKTSKAPHELDAIVAKLRIYAISDQDDAGPWIRREFPRLHFIGIPSTTDGEQYYLATWTGISGDRFYRNAPGADFTTFTDAWINDNIRGKGPLGKHYPFPCCIHEGDTPSFLGLINNGLASFMSPSYGGWGGRYVWRAYFGETRPSWTQGGDSFPGRDNSRDTVTGIDGQAHTTDQATIWRWRTAFQHDFAARMDWTVRAPRDANHNPVVVVNGQPGKAPIAVDATRGVPFVLDAAGTRSRRQRSEVRVVLLSRGRHGDSRRTGGRRRLRGNLRRYTRRWRPPIGAARWSSRASATRDPAGCRDRARDGDASCRRHRPHHSGG